MFVVLNLTAKNYGSFLVKEHLVHLRFIHPYHETPLIVWQGYISAHWRLLDYHNDQLQTLKAVIKFLNESINANYTHWRLCIQKRKTFFIVHPAQLKCWVSWTNESKEAKHLLILYLLVYQESITLQNVTEYSFGYVGPFKDLCFYSQSGHKYICL